MTASHPRARIGVASVGSPGVVRRRQRGRAPGGRCAIASSMLDQALGRGPAERRAALAQDVGERRGAADRVEVEERGRGRPQPVPARVGLCAEHARLLAARDEQVDLGVLQRRGGALGGELHRDGGARGVVARARDVLPRSSRSASSGERDRHSTEGRGCAGRRRRAGGARAGRPPAASAEIAGICSNFARCGTTAGWKIRPERLVSRWPTRQTRRRVGPRGRHACDDVDAGLACREHPTPASSAGRPRARRDRARQREGSAAATRAAVGRALQQSAGQRCAEEQAVRLGEGGVAGELLGVRLDTAFPQPCDERARRRVSPRPSTGAGARCRSPACGSRRAPPAARVSGSRHRCPASSSSHAAPLSYHTKKRAARRTTR